MAKDESVVKRECVVTPEQEAILTGHQKPILLLDRRSDGGLASSVAPNNPKVGVMLPYAPVQLLILRLCDSIASHKWDNSATASSSSRQIGDGFLQK